MTRKEAIARIENHKIAHKMSEPRAIYISEALEMAIKALEQDDVLDKIEAEIEEIETYDGLYIDRAYVLQIINKYNADKAESEEVNAGSN